MPKSSFVDFKAVKAAVDMEHLLQHYGILEKLKANGTLAEGRGHPSLSLFKKIAKYGLDPRLIYQFSIVSHHPNSSPNHAPILYFLNPPPVSFIPPPTSHYPPISSSLPLQPTLKIPLPLSLNPSIPSSPPHPPP
jgi:hypothetical protein